METTTLTPAERLAIYEKMLPYFEGEERLVDELGTIDFCFCYAIESITHFTVGIEELPELMRLRPHNYTAIWFPHVKKGPDTTRTAALHEAISEVKQLINDPAIL